jgi:hypothetical protein
MKALLRLLTSPFSLIRATTTIIATLLISQAGVWYENSLFGELAVFYGIAYGLAILAKGGGDAVFTKELASGEERNVAFSAFFSASGKRLLLAAPFISAVAFVKFGYQLQEVFALIALSCVIVVGNALRIYISPNYQLGYDNSAFTVIAILLTVLTGMPVWVAALCLAVVLGAIQFQVLRRIGKRVIHPVSMLRTSSGYFMTSELSYYMLGFAAPGMISLVADLDAVGMIRSVERLVFSGTFALFIINNRFFYDLSHTDGSKLTIRRYLRSYSLPSLLFFLPVLGALIAGSIAGIFPNIAKQPLVFGLFAGAYFISVTCGPVGGALNYLNEERFMMICGLLSAAIVIIFLWLAILLQSPILIVWGSALGISTMNLAQISRLFAKLRY